MQFSLNARSECCPSLHLKESFEGSFFFKLGGPGLTGLLLSIVGAVEARQGNQLFGRSPQWSNGGVAPSPPTLSSAQMVDTSSTLTELDSILSLFLFNRSLGLWFSCWPSEGTTAWVWVLSPSSLFREKTLGDEMLNLDELSWPLRDEKSAHC